MKIARSWVLLGLLAAGCANSLRVDTATMPPGTFTFSDVDTAALSEATQSLGEGATVPTSVPALARALADVEYISGAFSTHARWLGTDASAQEQLLIARREIRHTLGISQQAPSQAVVDGLLAVSRAGTPAALQAALADPVFSAGPQATEAVLEHFPPLFSTPPAIAAINRAKDNQNGECSFLYC